MQRIAALVLMAIVWMPAAAASLTWTRVADLPATDIESVRRNGATLFAVGGGRVYTGADNGRAWSASSPVDAGDAPLVAVLPAGGSLWVGSYGQGAFRSPDGGSTWTRASDGLVGLGALHINELASRNDTLFVGTDGAGVFALELAAPTSWNPFNNGLPTSIAGTVSTIVLHGTTLVAQAGGNGFVFRRPQGATAWREVALQPPILPGFVASDLSSSGETLLVASGALAYRSVDDAQSWTRADAGLANGLDTRLTHDGAVFLAVVNFLDDSHRLFRTADGGMTWQQIDQVTGAYVYGIEVAGDRLFAARTDGLWWTPLGSTTLESVTWGQIKATFGH